MQPIIDGMLRVLAPIDGAKTYLGGLGLAVMACFAAYGGQYLAAGQCLGGALVAIGLRHALDKADPPMPAA